MIDLFSSFDSSSNKNSSNEHKHNLAETSLAGAKAIAKFRALYFMLGLGLVGTFYGQSAYACPVVTNTNQVSKVSNDISLWGRTIYFCKQDFAPAQLMYQPTEDALVNGGSQVVSMGDTAQTYPMSNSINLSGFTPSQLNLNALTTNMPTNGGGYNVMSLFNFYTQVSSIGDSCNSYFGTNQFDKIREYLRANANIFQANNGAQTGVRSNVGNDLAVIKDVTIAHNSQTNSPLKADITFYHANAGKGGQWFTSGGSRFCWVGVSSRVDIKTDGANGNNLKYAGDYNVDVGVLTQ